MQFCYRCRHTIHQGFVVDLNKINNRFLRNFSTSSQLPNTVTICNSNTSQVKNRNNLFARMEPFAKLYGRNDQVDHIFDNALEDLEKLQVRKNPGMPPTLTQSGAAFCHPSHNVIGGRPSTKRKRHCSQCGSQYHDARNCPHNQNY